MLEVFLEDHGIGEVCIFEIRGLKAPMETLEFFDDLVHFVMENQVEKRVNFGEISIDFELPHDALGVLEEFDLEQHPSELRGTSFSLFESIN